MAAFNVIQKFKDQNLYSRLKRKDQEAFVEMYDLYVDDINRFVYFKVGSQEEAKDLTSLIFLKTWDYLRGQNFIDSRTVRSLLYKIARTSIVDYYRHKQPLTSLDNEEQPIDVIDDKQDVHEQISFNSDLDLVKNKLSELKNEYREIIVWRFINDLSLDEIAEITGKTKGNVKVLINRAIKTLKELIENK
jgi:RNA polymerase sigma-70 factor, ECF subfamily